MARTAAQSGIATIAATPHLRADFPGVHVRELAGHCQRLREALAHERIPLQLISGAEVSLVWALEASDEELALASYGQLGSDLLLETPFTPPAGLDQFIGVLQDKGYRVTLGHPERSRYFQRDASLLRLLASQGVLIQLNADSLIGPGGGRQAKQLARELLADGLVHAVASDGHRGSSWRPVTRLAEAAREAAELVGPPRARWLFEAAPAAIATGAELPAPPPITSKRRRRRLFGLR